MFHEKGTIRINSVFYHQVRLFLVASKAENKNCLWNEIVQPFSVPLKFRNAFHQQSLCGTVFSQNFKCHFLPLLLCASSEHAGSRLTAADLITGTPRQTVGVTIGVKLSQPDLCQTQGRWEVRAAGFYGSAVPFWEHKRKKGNEKRAMVFTAAARLEWPPFSSPLHRSYTLFLLSFSSTACFYLCMCAFEHCVSLASESKCIIERQLVSQILFQHKARLRSVLPPHWSHPCSS